MYNWVLFILIGNFAPNICETDINDMVGSWFFDENFNGLSEEFFDKVIKTLDFPLEDDEKNAGEDWNAKLQCLEPPSMDILAGIPSDNCDRHRSDSSKVGRSFYNLVSCHVIYLF